VNVALIEPYYGGSHKVWADGYAAATTHQVRLFTHEARFWKWRMHGAFLTLAGELSADIAANGPVDVILASSMMDVAAFAGAVRQAAPGVPIVVYFHESQFTYPLSPADKTDMTYPMKNWVSAVVADLVVFNSEYHRSLFRTEVRSFLNVFPEDKHVDRVDDVIDATIVLPVGVDVRGLIAARRRQTSPPLILWNHRWEHDKGPDDLAAIVGELLDRGVEFTMAMCGEVFVSVPEEFGTITEMLGDRLVHEGWADRPRYEALLSEASVVLSTAHQEFFGIGVVEAVAAGAHPVLPDRLVYPERVAAIAAEPSAVLYSSPEHACDLISAAFERGPSVLREATLQYDWSMVAPSYDGVLSDLVTRSVG
jgi:glycosyltransferase involved in cell wall biosynthesis